MALAQGVNMALLEKYCCSGVKHMLSAVRNGSGELLCALGSPFSAFPSLLRVPGEFYTRAADLEESWIWCCKWVSACAWERGNSCCRVFSPAPVLICSWFGLLRNVSSIVQPSDQCLTENVCLKNKWDEWKVSTFCTLCVCVCVTLIQLLLSVPLGFTRLIRHYWIVVMVFYYNIKLVLKLTSLRRNITHLLIISHVHKLHDPLLYVRSAAIPKVPLGSAQFCQELFGFGRRNCNWGPWCCSTSSCHWMEAQQGVGGKKGMVFWKILNVVEFSISRTKTMLGTCLRMLPSRFKILCKWPSLDTVKESQQRHNELQYKCFSLWQVC